MHYVYVIKSKQDGELYIGSTNDLRRRLAEHNAGYIESTAKRRPFVLRYYEAYYCEKDARLRESRLKQDGRARSVLKKGSLPVWNKNIGVGIYPHTDLWPTQ